MMGLTRVRFTVRRLMITVATAAFIIFGEQMRCRWLEHRTKYEDFKFYAQEMRASLNDPPQIYNCAGNKLSEEVLAEIRLEQVEWRLRFIRYAEAQRDKYAAAMLRPWLVVEPDPPEPQQCVWLMIAVAIVALLTAGDIM